MREYKSLTELANTKFEFQEGERLAAVLMCVTLQGESLAVFRAPDLGKEFEKHWGLLGGKVEEGETPYEAVIREVDEEAQYKVAQDQIEPYRMETFIVDDMTTHVLTFLQIVKEPFTPKLKLDEHTHHDWPHLEEWPEETIPSVKNFVSNEGLSILERLPT